MHSNSQKAQSGRSMIEIIAVILLIGLLIMGGVLLYFYVVAKNNANNIQTRANQRAASIMTSASLAKTKAGGDLEALGFADDEAGMNWKYVKLDGNKFGVSVNVVTKKTCEILTTMDLGYLEAFNINGKCLWAAEGSTCDKTAQCAEVGNTVEFVYSAESLNRAVGCTSGQLVCGVSCCNAGQFCLNASSRRGGLPICCDREDDLNCGGNCCPQGTSCCEESCCTGDKTCCNGGCYSACNDVGMTGARDLNTCLCACDTSKGFLPTADGGACVCQAKKQIKNGECVCGDVVCDTSTDAFVNDSCECDCPAGKVISRLGDGKCVECDDKDDCNPDKCQDCEDGKCKGQCCIDSGKACEDGVPCCNTPCSKNNICCSDAKGTCLDQGDCCNSDFICETGGCCAPLAVACSAMSDCCDNGHGCATTTGSQTVCCVPKLANGCGSASDCCGGMPCTNSTCCRERKTACVGEGECCYGLPCTDSVCCSPLGKTCEEQNDCCGAGSSCFGGECCLPAKAACAAVAEDTEHDYCCGNYACVGNECCIPKGETGCSAAVDDCCSGIPCTDGKCCVPIKLTCTEAGECCNQDLACDLTTGTGTVCCYPPKTQGCKASDECCNGMECTNGSCCTGLRKACTSKDECCLETAACAEVKTTETVCCLPTQTQGCTAADDCCNGVACTDGQCCVARGKTCVAHEECCGGTMDSATSPVLCKGEGTKAICCSADGVCTNTDECKQCCLVSKSASCEWKRSGSSSAYTWTRKCTDAADTTAIYGLDPQSKQERCCSSSEYLVPSFSTKFETNMSAGKNMYCCPDQSGSYDTTIFGTTNVMEYSYYDESLGQCVLLGECPSPYDGVVLVLDFSASMHQNKVDGEYYDNIVKDALTKVFNNTQFDWTKIKVGIYRYSSTSSTVLKYNNYTASQLKNAVSSLKASGDTCTACGLNEAISDVLDNGGASKNAPLFVLLTDGYETTYVYDTNDQCGTTRSIAKNAGSYCINYENKMYGIDVRTMSLSEAGNSAYDFYVRADFESKSNPLSKESQMYKDYPNGFGWYIYAYDNPTKPADINFSTKKVILRHIWDKTHYATGTLKTGNYGQYKLKLYQNAQDKVQELVNKCSNFSGNFYAYSIGGNYLNGVTGVNVGVLSNASAIETSLANAFASFKDCIPKQKSNKCK